jgi:hypothetical protein
MAAASIPATKANPTTPIHNPNSSSLPRYRPPAGDISDGVEVFSAALHKYDTPDAGLRASLAATPQRTHLSDGIAEPLMAIAIGVPSKAWFNPRCRVCWSADTLALSWLMLAGRSSWPPDCRWRLW